MEETEVIELLRKRTDELSVTRVAQDIDVSIQYVSDVLRGRRRPSEKILTYLGLQRKIVKVR